MKNYERAKVVYVFMDQDQFEAKLLEEINKMQVDGYEVEVQFNAGDYHYYGLALGYKNV